MPSDAERNREAAAATADGNDPIHASWLAVLTDPVRLSLLRCLSRLGEMTTPELALRAHTSESTARRHLDAMVELGLVRERRGQSDGETPGRPAASYALSRAAQGQLTALFELLSRPL